MVGHSIIDGFLNTYATLRGRPPFRPFLRAAASFSLERALPPAAPSRRPAAAWARLAGDPRALPPASGVRSLVRRRGGHHKSDAGGAWRVVNALLHVRRSGLLPDRRYLLTRPRSPWPGARKNGRARFPTPRRRPKDSARRRGRRTVSRTRRVPARCRASLRARAHLSGLLPWNSSSPVRSKPRARFPCRVGMAFLAL
jgi:hypothetical protein